MCVYIYIYEKGKVLPSDLKFVLDRAKSSRGNFSINPSTSLPAVRLGLSDLVFPGNDVDVTSRGRKLGRGVEAPHRLPVDTCPLARSSDSLKKKERD